MHLFSKFKDHINLFQSHQHTLVLWLVSIALLLMLALSVYASFIFAKIEEVGEQTVGLEMQALQIANDQAQINQKLDGVQTMLLRLQSQAYRSGLTEEE